MSRLSRALRTVAASLRIASSASSASPIAAENRLVGSSAWLMGMEGSRAADDVRMQVKGFASASSVEVGDSIDFCVSVAEGEEFTVGVYRLGFYGGKGARKVAESPRLAGVVQPEPEIDAESGLITCPWSVSWTLSVGSDWVSGLYVAVFTTASGWRSYTPFVVRDSQRPAALCVVIPSTTYQAHNQWPLDGQRGRSLYYGYRPEGGRSYEHRAVKVSYDRPYQGNGLPGHLMYDQAFIGWAESEGYDLTYVDSVDLHLGRVDPSRYKGLVFGGYDAYWSAPMRALAEQAVAGGTSLVFLTAGNLFWYARVEPSAGGRDGRIVVCYKTTPDPDDGPATGKWRNRAPSPGQPEQPLLGVQYRATATHPTDLVVQNADHWLWRGAGVADGDRIEGVVGGATDGHYPNVPVPADSAQTLLAASPFVALGGAEQVQHTSICEHANGAVVFVAGSLHWPHALTQSDRGEAAIRTATANLLDHIVGGRPAAHRARPLLGAAPAGEPNPVVLENRLRGSSAWLMGMEGSRAADDVRMQVKGFASASSVEVGDSIDFCVSVAEGEEFTVGVYRLGFYGGKGARKVAESPRLAGVVQPEPEIDAESGLITCPWSVSWTLSVGSDWVSGLYVAVFTTASGWRSYTPFVVRDSQRPAALCAVVPSTTYQAYNQFPLDGKRGRSLYYGYDPATGQNMFEHRAHYVSYDRPYAEDGLPTRFAFDRDFIRWAEAEGFDLTYVDSVDLHLGRIDPSRYKGLVFIGHDEYWSLEMRTLVERGLASGTSLAFMGANNVYWHIRMRPNAAGRDGRVVVCYKHESDPEYDEAGTTVMWRNESPAPNRPEQELLGIQFNGIVTYPAPLVVQNADHWFWRDSGVVDGQQLEAVVGGEADGVDPACPLPRGGVQTLLSASPYRLTEGDDASDDVKYGEAVQNTSVWEADNGAIVFAAGSLDWPAALGRYERMDPHVQRATANVLWRISDGKPTR